jgi:hypothetical protein
MAPPKDVTAIFRLYQGQWEDALARWEKKCAPFLEEKDKFRVTGGSPASGEAASEKPEDESELQRYLDDLSPEARKRALAPLAARCERVIPKLKRGIVMLQEAQHSGVWSGAPQLRISVFSVPRFLGKKVDYVAREERMTVLEVKGEWWRVRTVRGTEGWVNRSQVKPQLPVELSSKPGTDSTFDPNIDSAPRG